MNQRSAGDQHVPLGDLLALGNQIRTDETPESLLHEVAETLRRVVVSAQVYVRLRNEDSDAFEAAAFAGVVPELEAILRQEPVLPGTYSPLLRPELRVSDSYVIPVGGTAPNAADAAAAPSAVPTLLVPLRGRGDRLIGVIYIALSSPAALDQTAAQVIEAIARQAALAVENVRLAERSARLLAKEQLLAELGRDVSITLHLDDILNRTVERLAAAFGSGSLCLLEEDGTPVVVATAPNEIELIGIRLSNHEGMVGWVVQHGRSFFANKIQSDPAFAPINPAYQSCIAAPLRSGGQVIGTLNVGSQQVGAFAYDDVDLLEAIAAQVGGPITSARLYQQSQRLAAHIQRHADRLAVLNSIARTASATLEQEDSLPKVTMQIHNGFGYDHVDLFLIDDESNELVMASSCGILSPMAAGYRQHLNLGIIGESARRGQTICVDDVQSDPHYFVVAERSSTRAELCVPIMASGRTLGLLNLESPQLHAFSDEDVAIIEMIADVLAGTLENARLYRRAQAAAVFEERNRLARELHDSVSQQLFSITLTAQAARSQLEKNPQRVAGQLERLQETATAALAEMRALIFQLRPPALRDQGLVAALQQHAQALSRREGLAIALSVVGDDRQARGIEQPLFRIVQESLNNVVKHADARNVTVTLEFGNERVVVRVTDDGHGFDLSAPPSGHGRHLGMISMRERAAEIGGTMEVRSMIGGGTEVMVIVPRVSDVR